jgi:hypothetical protein
VPLILAFWKFSGAWNATGNVRDNAALERDALTPLFA